MQAFDHPVTEAKEAILSYDVMQTSSSGSNSTLSRLEITLYTGRPHQIRVQLATIGCPLWGDQRYGAAYNKSGQQIALWATRLSFMHPVSKQTLTFHSEPPRTFPWST